MPIYALYALLFAGTGLSTGEISALFAIWSLTGFVAEVPTGALADRFSRRGALVAAGLLEAAGFALWLARPGFVGFALGFVLWGVGGALVSGALEALLFDGLAAWGEEEHFGPAPRPRSRPPRSWASCRPLARRRCCSGRAATPWCWG